LHFGILWQCSERGKKNPCADNKAGCISHCADLCDTNHIVRLVREEHNCPTQSRYDGFIDNYKAYCAPKGPH
jgi:hypothetical protein